MLSSLTSLTPPEEKRVRGARGQAETKKEADSGQVHTETEEAELAVSLCVMFLQVTLGRRPWPTAAQLVRLQLELRLLAQVQLVVELLVSRAKRVGSRATTPEIVPASRRTLQDRCATKKKPARPDREKCIRSPRGPDRPARLRDTVIWWILHLVRQPMRGSRRNRPE